MKRQLFIATGMTHRGLKHFHVTSIVAAPDKDAANAYWQGMDFYPNEVRAVDLDLNTGMLVLPVVKSFETEVKG